MRLLAIVLLAAGVWAQPSHLPLEEVKRGQKGVGKTVFAGSAVETFDVEVLGILENIGPKQSLILARLSGGPLERTGVLQGMSGSPVYIEDRLAGAVAVAFPFSKEAIAGIRPIGDMLRVEPTMPAEPTRRAAVTLFDRDLTTGFPAAAAWEAGGVRLEEIATPVSFGGFTQRTLNEFAPRLRALGLEPMQGLAGGGGGSGVRVGAVDLEPGSMITVHLMMGDLSIGADGTVTHVEGNRVWAFGHRFLALGNTSFPFSRSEVLTLLPNLNVSFKISAARDGLGAITADRSAAITGELGRSAEVTPVTVTLRRLAADGGRLGGEDYRMAMVRDALLSPVLLQMAVFSAIDATESAVSKSTYRLRGAVEFEGVNDPMRLDAMYADDFAAPARLSLAAALPLAYAMQGGFEELRPKRVDFEIDTLPGHRQLRIVQAWPDRSQAKPGETLEISALLASEDGMEMVRKASYRVPPGAEAGPLMFTIADGSTMNLLEARRFLTTPRTPGQLVELVNALRPNHRAFVRVWRQSPAYSVEGKDLPAPPASIALILGGERAATGGLGASYNSKLAEFEMPLDDLAVTGSETLKVEIKE